MIHSGQFAPYIPHFPPYISHISGNYDTEDYIYMNINLLKPAAAKRISKFNDNVIHFFVCFPLVLSCLRRKKKRNVSLSARKHYYKAKIQTKYKRKVTPFRSQSHVGQAFGCLDIFQQPCCMQYEKKKKINHSVAKWIPSEHQSIGYIKKRHQLAVGNIQR